MWKFLLAAAIAVTALDFTLGCDGNFEPLRTCMKANLPNATKIAEQVKDCYTKSGCGDFSNEPPAKKKLFSQLYFHWLIRFLTWIKSKDVEVTSNQ